MGDRPIRGESSGGALVRLEKTAEPARNWAPVAETSALAADCRNFAELLARASNGRSWE